MMEDLRKKTRSNQVKFSELTLLSFNCQRHGENRLNSALALAHKQKVQVICLTESPYFEDAVAKPILVRDNFELKMTVSNVSDIGDVHSRGHKDFGWHLRMFTVKLGDSTYYGCSLDWSRSKTAQKTATAGGNDKGNLYQCVLIRDDLITNMDRSSLSWFLLDPTDESGLQRPVMVCRVMKRYEIACIHSPSGTTENKKKQYLKNLINIVQTKSEKKLPILICGDFNLDPKDGQSLLKTERLVNYFGICSAGEMTHKGGRELDWALLYVNSGSSGSPKPVVGARGRVKSNPPPTLTIKGKKSPDSGRIVRYALLPSDNMLLQAKRVLGEGDSDHWGLLFNWVKK